MKRFLSVILILLLAAVYPLFSFVFSQFSVSAKKADLEPGLAALERFSSVSVEKVQEKLDAKELARLQELAAQKRDLRISQILQLINAGKLSYPKALKDLYIAGDSLMEGLADYRILNSSHVIAQVSASLYHLEGNLGKIISLRPPILLLHYGLNMLENDDAHLNTFIRKYTGLIKQLQEALPNTRIVVSLMFPVDRQKATESIYGRIGAYNKRMKQMAQELGVEALDSAPAFGSSTAYYGRDGIHLSSSFYREIWLKYLIRELEIY